MSAGNVGVSKNRHVLHMCAVQPDRVNSDWTYATTFTYNVSEADMRLNDNLMIHIKNPEPPTSVRDEYRKWAFGRLPVSDGRLPAVITDMHAEYADSNKVITSPASTPLPIGTKLRIVASGSDPKGLPLEYRFLLLRNGTGTDVLQDWSPSNVFYHTLAHEDTTAQAHVCAIIRNSDGWGHMWKEWQADNQVRV